MPSRSSDNAHLISRNNFDILHIASSRRVAITSPFWNEEVQCLLSHDVKDMVDDFDDNLDFAVSKWKKLHRQKNLLSQTWICGTYPSWP